MPPLTEATIRAIKQSGRVERYYDGYGLYLELSKAGSKLWRWKYRFGCKEKRLSFGAWPETTLKQAREKMSEARKILRSGTDPGVDSSASPIIRDGPNFEIVARAWVADRLSVWSQVHAETVVSRLIKDVYPEIGAMPISAISPVDVLGLIKKIETRDAKEVAKRVLGICSQIFSYGVAMQFVGSDPCRDLAGALAPRLKANFPALTTKEEVGELMLSIDDYKGTAVVRAALVFSALTFCRPGPIRHAEWLEIDWKNKLWLIPAAKMKLTKEAKLRKEPHVVPLSTQAVDILSKIQHFTGRGRYVFPNPRDKNLPMSEAGVNVALKRMGYEGRMTAHGFRATASTLLNEAGYRHDVIEAQLAHTSADKVRAIYNRAQYLVERRKLMQAWADMLDELKQAATAKETLHNL